MKKIISSIVLLASGLCAQNTNGHTPVPVTFALLSTINPASNPQTFYCTDCKHGAPVIGGGNGAYVQWNIHLARWESTDSSSCDIPSAFSGALLVMGQVTYQTVAIACTLTGSNLTMVGTGSVTFDIWVIAGGGSLPTAAQSITAAAQPIISTAGSVLDTTLTGWTTLIPANSVVGIQLSAVSGTPTYASINIK